MDINLKKLNMNQKNLLINEFIILCLFASSTLFFSRCNSMEEDQSKISKKILVADNCFWDIINNESNKRITKCYQFRDNGDALYYSYDREGLRTPFDFGDLIVSNRWELLKSNVLVLNGDTMKVLNYNVDTIHLQAAINGEYISMVKNCRR